MTATVYANHSGATTIENLKDGQRGRITKPSDKKAPLAELGSMAFAELGTLRQGQRPIGPVLLHRVEIPQAS